MEDKIKYGLHIKSLNQIKKRTNQYPTFGYGNANNNKKTIKDKQIDSLKTKIKANNKNIASVVNNLNNKKIYKNNDQYLNEIENIQNIMLCGLLIENKKLKKELKSLKNIKE